MRRAFEEDRVIVTLDADFHALLALSQASKPSIIRIRIEGLRAEKFHTLLRDVILQCHADLEAGVLLTVRENRIRMRHLPITRFL